MTCKAAKYARSTYYNSLKPSVIDERDKQFISDMKEFLGKTDLRKGSVYKAKTLGKKINKPVNHKRMERICQKYGLLSRVKRANHPKGYYQNAREKEGMMPGNILARNFVSTKPMEKVVTDITYFAVKEGWLYLSVAKDLYDKSILAYSMSCHIDTKLVLATLEQFRGKEHVTGAIWHSDLGCTYTANDYLVETDIQGWTKSFSNKGQCWDNACMENWFGILKAETEYYDTLKPRKKLWTYEEAEAVICEYIKYYNEERLQKKLNWMSPIEFRLHSA